MTWTDSDAGRLFELDLADRGSDQRSWWDLGVDGWKTVLVRTARQFGEDDIATQATAVTLRIVLAIVPSLIAGVAVAANVVSTQDITELVGSAQDVVPGSASEFVESSLNTALEKLQTDGILPLVASIAVGLFAANTAAAALVNALNSAFDVEEGRGFLGQRLTALGVIGASTIALVGMVVVVVLGPTLLEFVVPAAVLDSPVGALLTVGRYAAAVVILILFFGFCFWFGPHRDRPQLRFVTPGAVAGVIGWLVLSWLFNLYVQLSATYANTYGAFAGVMVLLIWLNYSFIVLLMGAELDHEIERHLDGIA